MSYYGDFNGRFVLSRDAETGTVSPTFDGTEGAHTAMTASTEYISYNFDASSTKTFLAGTITNQRAALFKAPTYAFDSSSSIRIAATVAIDKPPQEGTNASFNYAAGLFVGDVTGSTSASAFSASQMIVPTGIANGTTTATERVAIHIADVFGGNISLGNQTATLTDLIGIDIEQLNVDSTTNTRTVTNAVGLRIQGAFTNGGNVTFTNAPIGLQVKGTTTFAQVAGSVPRAIDIPAYTVTLSNTTQVTSVGPAALAIAQMTIAQSGGAVTVDNASSLYIANAPAAGASVTLTNPYSIFVDAGLTRLDGGVVFAASGQSTLSNYTEGTFTPTVTLVDGGGNTVPEYSTNTGRYTRIGNRVFVDVYLSGDGGAEGAGTGQINVALPIAANASHPSGYFMVGNAVNNTSGYLLAGQIVGGESTVSLCYYSGITSTPTAIFGMDQNHATRSIRLKFAYEV